jgi:hypothetical protein
MEVKRVCAYATAALGAGALLGALWLPWYRFHVSAQMARQLGAATGAAAQADPFIRFVQTGGSLHLSGWQLIGSTRVVIALTAALILALVLAGLVGVARSVAGKAISVFGFVGLVAVGEHMIFPPGPAGTLSVRWGAFLALAGGVVAILAGRLAQPPGATPRRRRPPESRPPRPSRPSFPRSHTRPGAARTRRHLRPVK